MNFFKFPSSTLQQQSDAMRKFEEDKKKKIYDEEEKRKRELQEEEKRKFELQKKKIKEFEAEKERKKKEEVYSLKNIFRAIVL